MIREGGLLGRNNHRGERGVLILVENLPVPFDRRVWLEAKTLRDKGFRVAVVSPKGLWYQEAYEEMDGIHIYRYPLSEASTGVTLIRW